MRKRPVNIVVAECHTVFRNALIDILKSHDIHTAGDFENGQDLIHALDSLSADLVLMDLDMPVMNGAIAAQLIREKFPGIKIIILTQYDNPQLAEHLIGKGINAFLTKSVPIETLVEIIRQVAWWDVTYNPYEERRRPYEKTAGSKIKFSRREIEIISLIHDGKSNKEISNDLNIVLKTVEAHKKNIYSKTGTKNLTQFLVMSLKYGFKYLY